MENKFKWTSELVTEFFDYIDGRSGACLTVSLMEEFQRSKETELQWYVIPYETDSLAVPVKGWTPIKQHKGNMGGYFNAKYFPDKVSAREWIISNKPCLSLQEVYSFHSGSDPAFSFWRHLQELVKTKI